MTIKLRIVPAEHLFRNMVRQGIGLKPTALFSEQEELGLQASCINCLFFTEQTEICKRYNARPPARIIAMSCKDWDDKNDVPF
jgi:hypothetical protein